MSYDSEAGVELLEMNDMGDFYLTSFIAGLDGLNESSRRRVVLIGSSRALLFHLIRSGYRVLYIDKDPSEIEDQRRALSENLPEDELVRFQSKEVDVEKEDAGFLPDDIICFVRSLHHMRNPSEALQTIYRKTGNVIVCDTSVDLFEEGEKLYESDEEINRVCLEMLRQHGFKNEKAVETFLAQSGFDLGSAGIQFYYRLRCPCGGWDCSSVCTYWFLVAEKRALHTP